MTEIMQIIILGVVEGLTEFIPVSSTGHLIIVGHLIGFVGEKAATFDVFIQLGAILAVVFLYKERFLSLLSFENKPDAFSGRHGLLLLATTTLPALVIGALVHSYIKRYLFGPTTVAIGLGIGGVIMIFIEGRRKVEQRAGLHTLRVKDALAIGFFQCLAMWPGVSRSGATMVGGMLMGIERKTAAEYSFLAAVPVMAAATVFDLYKAASLLTHDYLTFLAGFGISFIAAMIAVKTFIKLLGKITLKPFGWYRIGIALLILGFMRT
jgi:undecaprenyl-diphosphatase